MIELVLEILMGMVYTMAEMRWYVGIMILDLEMLKNNEFWMKDQDHLRHSVFTKTDWREALQYGSNLPSNTLHNAKTIYVHARLLAESCGI